MSEERRHFSRVPYHTEARLEGPDGTFSVEVLDISMKGALLRLPEEYHLEKDAAYSLHIPLSEVDEHEAVTMDLTVAHREEREIGLVCTRIDLDSLIHLRSLIEANLGDPELVHRELKQLADGP